MRKTLSWSLMIKMMRMNLNMMMMIRIILMVRRKENEDSKKIQMKETIYVDVVRVIYHMQLYIHMLRLSIKGYFQREQQIFKKKVNKVLVQIVGKLIVITAIYLKLMSSIKVLKNL
jgi:hypothetical protein